MKPIRLIVGVLIAAVALYCVLLAVGLLLPAVELTPSARLLISLLGAVVAATLLQSGILPPDLGAAVLRSALIVGVIGFAVGFFGPMLLAPSANQGPLLGVLITGPLGFLAGAVLGVFSWLARGRKIRSTGAG